MKNPRLQRRGFTLVELMVSLVMGLVVALAAVGLARNATTAFHEQARSSTAQMSLRIASDRLRQDLMRTSYMSTGNIAFDPKLARREGASGLAGVRYPELAALPTPANVGLNIPLRGIAIDVGMTSITGGVPGPLATNGLKPDAIYLVGNFKSDEVYSGTLQPPGAAPGGGGGACLGTTQTITLDATSDAPTYFMSLDATGAIKSETLVANAGLIFTPVPGNAYLAQVTDANNCTNYVPVCNIAANGTTQVVISVDGRNNPPAVLLTNNDGGQKLQGTCGSSEVGPVTIAPLALVRWSIQPSVAMLENDPAIEPPGDKFDLVREMFDFDGRPFQREVVAEYVIDLKFGISIDDPAVPAGALRQKVFDSEDDPGGLIGKVTLDPATVAGAAGPQRVRSVRYRLASRVAIPDRESDLALGAGPTLARYCTEGPLASCKKWARVRTVNSEVVLSNQAGMNY